MARHRTEVTVREGTGKKYWYTQMGHVAVSVAGLLLFGYLAATSSSQGDAYLAGSYGLIILLGALVLSVISVPALFRDSAYLRESSRRWRPKWWYYIGGGIAPAIILFVVGDFANAGIGGFALALLGLLVGTVIMNSVYLYRRHQYIGVP